MQGVLGYETITGTTPTPASVRRQASVRMTSVVLATVEHARSSGRSELQATMQGLVGLGREASFCASVVGFKTEF